jgi:arylsulfatase
VLVTVDTLRREHLGCYGYRRPTSPRVDDLAREAVVFDSAFAPMATTFPSHLTMFTGLYPAPARLHVEPLGDAPALSLERGLRKLPRKALRAAGYRTAAFVSSVVLHERTGIGTGFDHFEGPGPEVGKYHGARDRRPRAGVAR